MADRQDANGSLVQRTDAGGEITAYQYSSMNRLTNVVHQGQWKAAFSYDANGNTTIISNPVSRIAYSYDPMNRLANSTLTVSTISTSLTVSSSYDLNGNRTNIVYPGGLSVGYSYDAENRLVGVTTKYTNSTKTFAFGYDGASRLTNLVYPNGVQAALAYDAESRVLEYRHSKGASNLLRHVIIRDPRGFKTTEDIYAGLIPNFTNSLHQARTHNDADQLTAATSSLTNQVNYSYDNNGCLTSSVSSATSAVYQYDFDNRLTSVSSVSSVVQYLYDASGARVGRVTSPGVTNYFVIDYKAPLKMPLAEADALGRITRYYVWSSHGLLAHLDMNPTNGALLTTRYYHADEQGSTLALTDASGAVTDQFAYSPYGQTLGRTGTNNTPYQWLGGLAVRNEGGGLYYMLNRYYSVDQHRFISPDPMGVDGGANLYAYGDLNPLAYSDPFGLEARDYSNPFMNFSGMSLDFGVPNIAKDLQTWGDRVGWVNPVGDVFGALGYAAEGQWWAAGISVASIVGLDYLKGARYADDVAAPLWTSTKSKTAVENAFDHWEKHGSEFPELQNAKQYVEGTKDFFNNPPPGTLTKMKQNGDKLFYNPANNTFGVHAADGAPRTMFRPADGINYWNKQ